MGRLFSELRRGLFLSLLFTGILFSGQIISACAQEEAVVGSDLKGNAVGPFDPQQGRVLANETNTTHQVEADGRISYHLEFPPADKPIAWGSYGFDFEPPIDVKDGQMILRVKAENRKGVKLQINFRTADWGDVNRIQASTIITLSNQWEDKTIDLEDLGINFKTKLLKHFSFEWVVANLGNRPGDIIEIDRIAFKGVKTKEEPPEQKPLTDNSIVNWINSNTSSKGMPFSFQIAAEKLRSVYDKTADDYQWMVLRKGAVIYDVALAQILWAYTNDLESAEKIVWTFLQQDEHKPGEIVSFGSLADIRAWFGNSIEHPFRYNEKDSGKLLRPQGYIFKIIPATGEYQADYEFIGSEKWQDWLPISGENGWAGEIAALQLYYQKYNKSLHPESVELKLAEDIASVSMLLQAEKDGEKWGIRMGPLGTWSEEDEEELGPMNWQQRHFWYDLISTENNLSWYAGFRMLYEITHKQEYKTAFEGIERYLKSAFDGSRGYFLQGMHFSDGRWEPNLDPAFATDCQTWAIDVLGPEVIDKWFGEGTTYRLWEKTKMEAGVYAGSGELQGVDFTNYRQLGRESMVSYEWTAGAILATRILEKFYRNSHPDWADICKDDQEDMLTYVRSKAVQIDRQHIAWPYASGNEHSIFRSTGFGWYAPPEEVLSLASTAWMGFVELNLNPFFLGGKSPEWVSEPQGDITPPTIENLWVSKAEDIPDVRIQISTSEPVILLLEYGKTKGSFPHTAFKTTFSDAHLVELTGLEEETTYYYRLTLEDNSGNENVTGGEFTTIKVKKNVGVFAVGGDIILKTAKKLPEATVISLTNLRTKVVVKTIIDKSSAGRYFYALAFVDPTGNDAAEAGDTLSIIITEPEGNVLKESNYTITQDDIEDGRALIDILIEIPAPRLSDLRIEGITGNSAKLSWKTDKPTRSEVEVYEKIGANVVKEIKDEKFLTDHEVKITDLKPETKYGLIISAEDKYGIYGYPETGEFSFTTLNYGDVNGNGKVDSADALLVLKHSVELIELTPEQFKVADVNGDGKVSPVDASLILRYAVGLIKEFPVEKK